eukprot:2958146-Pleurochrysis_carterae.AAC.4
MAGEEDAYPARIAGPFYLGTGRATAAVKALLAETVAAVAGARSCQRHRRPCAIGTPCRPRAVHSHAVGTFSRA